MAKAIGKKAAARPKAAPSSGKRPAAGKKAPAPQKSTKAVAAPARKAVEKPAMKVRARAVVGKSVGKLAPPLLKSEKLRPEPPVAKKVKAQRPVKAPAPQIKSDRPTKAASVSVSKAERPVKSASVPAEMKPERPVKAPPPTPSRNGSTLVASGPIASAPVTVQPLAANGKARKNQAGFSSRELEHFRDLLLAKRRELIGDMSSNELEALRVGGGSNLSNLPIHMADMGTDNYEQEFTLGLVQKERDLLREINSALAKIQNGAYGLCEATGVLIIKERLEYQPWARYSVEHQRKLERHGR